tara:strand:- start:129954 stop:130139 length:186 start_codon:yes stop_codon:yes gene_type:complete
MEVRKFVVCSAVSLYFRQLFSYEHYGSKLAFAFRHAQGEIFLFSYFLCPAQKQNPKDFATS